MENKAGYKKTELGWIPEDWEVVKIKSFAKSVSKKNHDGKVNKVVSVTKYQGIVDSLEYFNKQVYSKDISTYKIIERNQFAYATIHLDEGSIGYLKDWKVAVLSPMYTVFSINKEHIDRIFFWTLVKSYQMISIYQHIGLGSVDRRKAIPFKVFGDIQIPLPPLPEQQKIAEILTTVDEKIAAIEQQITETQKLKKGLMQRLFTQGIGHTEFKGSKIGRIPKDWEVVRLQDIASIERGKFQHRPRNDPKFYGGKYPFVQTGDISNSNGKITSYSQTLNEKGLKVSKLFPIGTIIITIAANIGDTAIANFEICFPDSLVGIITNLNMNNQFLEYYLRIKKADLNKLATVSAQKNINIETLKPLLIPLPPLPEQEKIASILSTVDEKIETLQSKKLHYTTLKKGLMQKLLTGEIRVKV